MVVDDSAVIRGLLTRALESSPEISVVASAANGQMAVSTLARLPLDVIVLDIEMPVLDGLGALPQLLAVDRDVKIIMASTLTLRNAEISLRALLAGASDYIPKPSSHQLGGATDFQRELVAKVLALGAARRGAQGAVPDVEKKPSQAEPKKLQPLYAGKPTVLRPAPTIAPAVIAIGSSTGGPQALVATLTGLSPSVRQPILITQHMPATFTAILAEHLARTTKRPCREATDGSVLEQGSVFVAPGDFHMTVEPRGQTGVVRLLQSPPENFCRPAVDPMMRSLVKNYGKNVLAIILTGMGSDGLKGCGEVIAAGGAVIAQDETSSVVWGMPGAVATAGLCYAVLPVREIGPHVTRLIQSVK